MGDVQFYEGKVLFDDNKVAMHEDCCCDSICPHDDVDSLDVTFTGIIECPSEVCGGGVESTCDDDYNDNTFTCSWDASSGQWRYNTSSMFVPPHIYVDVECEGADTMGITAHRTTPIQLCFRSLSNSAHLPRTVYNDFTLCEGTPDNNCGYNGTAYIERT